MGAMGESRARTLQLLCAALLYGALAACGGSAATPPSGAGSTAPAPSAPPTPAADTTPPSVPDGASANALSATQVRIGWSAATDDSGAIAGYRVYRNGQRVGSTQALFLVDNGLTPSTTYSYRISAYDAADNESAQSTAVQATTPAASAGNTYVGNPTNYLTLLAGLKAGDTLVLEAGVYDQPNNVPGLPIFGLHGTASQPITITGPDSGPMPVLLGRATHNTVRLSDASYITIRNIEIDGRDLGGDGVKAQGSAHHITLEGLVIRGVGGDQQVVGISSNGAPVWNWIVRGNTIIGAGTGMYFGNSDGSNPFVAGLIEHNLVRDTIGYNVQIKHQNPRPSLAGMPTGASSTIIRHNVFHKSSNSSTGSLARPNLLVGHFPLTGAGANDVYEIYGNFFYQNPTEALFQGEGNIVFHHNLLVNDGGSAIAIQPHHDVPRTIRVFNNTVIAQATGISVSGGSSSFQQKVIGNAVFAGSPIVAPDRSDNITDSYANAGHYVNRPTGPLGTLDLFPRPGALTGTAIDSSSFISYAEWNVDFNGQTANLSFRGAYSGEGQNPGWTPQLEIKP